jgi:hypothetical protein
MVMLETLNTEIAESRSAIETEILYGIDRQAIINGNFDIWQRGTSFSARDYTADRWVYYDNFTSVATVARSTGVPNKKSSYSLRVFGATGGTSKTMTLRQKIEGQQARTFSGKEVTVSFYNYGDAITGTATIGVRVNYCSSVDNFTTREMTVVSDTTSATMDSDWHLYSFTFTLPDTSPTSSYSIANGIEAEITLTFSSSTDINVYFAQFQVCKGSVALPFCPKTYQQELLDCSRYYQVFSVDNYVCYADGNQLAVPFYGAVPMRLTGDLKAYAVTLSAIYAHRVNTTTVVTLYNTATAMTGSTNAVNYGVYGKTQGWIEWTGAITEDVYVANNSSSAGNQVSGTARFYIDVEL